MNIIRPINENDRIFLIDGSAFIFRAYHGLPPLSRRDGLPVGAVSGFCNMLFKLTEELKSGERPTHIAVIFDAGSKTFRNDIYTEYKSHRPPAPDDLVPQFALCRDAVRAFGIASIEMDGFEADDLIATYAEIAKKSGAKVEIYSSDKDLMQLVGGGVTMIDPMKNKRIDREQVFEKFGVYPESVIDVQSLAGDSSDNIPGIPGIGIKTAAELIQTFHTLDNLLENAHTIKQNKRRENLMNFADMARLSRQLVTLKTDIDVETPLENFILNEPDIKNIADFLHKMELNQLAKRIHARMGHDYIPESLNMPVPPVQPAQSDLFGMADLPVISVLPSVVTENPYRAITDINDFKNYITEIEKIGYIAFDTETTGLDIISDSLVGICLSHTAGTGIYIPLSHKNTEFQIPINDVLSVLKPVLESKSVLKIGHNIKFDMSFMKQHDIHITPIDDTMLLSFCLYGGKHRHNMNDLSALYLNHTPISFESVVGTGKNKITFDQVPLDKATDYAAEDADITLRLWLYLKNELIHQKKLGFYEMIERKMPDIVSDMEMSGILVDKQALTALSEKFLQESALLEQKIYTLAGTEFNIASPKQMGEILFDKMGLTLNGKQKKTSSGQMATGVDILEELATNGYEIAELILNWRGLQKLKSTYSDALREHINPKTQRVHTSFQLTGAATGRFSSTNPNVQNIPIRTAEGRLIRQAFIAKPHHKIICADYSQIELRILAHIADVTMLKQAFINGEDIHARTASEIFNIPLNDITPDIRRNAKAVNFGIIYGISAFGLARQLKIPQSEAKIYIDAYFAHLPQIKDYMEHTKQYAADHGYVETIFKRRVHIPDINARNFMQRSFAVRAAINAPIQGAAADIIKLAMIDCDAFIKQKYPAVKMLLQIHDELLFEVPDSQAESFAGDIKKIMENAPLKHQNLSVRPIVETGIGTNWNDAH